MKLENPKYSSDSALESTSDSDISTPSIRKRPNLPSASPPVQQLSRIFARKSLFFNGFSFGGSCNEISPYPGLFITSVGYVGLPILEHQIAEIIRVAKKNITGWNIAAPKISFTNPFFEDTLEQLKTRLAGQLGCRAGDIRMELREMAVIKSGAKVLRQKERKEEKRNRVGTLVVKPPTFHKGGELRVYRGSEIKVHQFGQASGNSPFAWYFAFFSDDSEFELSEVIEGYFSAFFYDVWWNEKVDVKNFADIDIKEEVEEELNALIKSEDPFLIHFFEKTYENFDKMVENTLEGVDRDQLALLKAANDYLERRFAFYLVEAEAKFFYEVKTNQKVDKLMENLSLHDCPEPDWTLLRTKTALNGWFSLDEGMLAANPGWIEEIRNILNPKQQSLNDFWLSNVVAESVNLDLKAVVCRRTLLVLWPSQAPPKHIFGDFVDKSPDAKALRAMISRHPNRKLTAEEASKLLNYVAARKFYELFPSTVTLLGHSKEGIATLLQCATNTWRRLKHLVFPLERLSLLEATQNPNANPIASRETLVELITTISNETIQDAAFVRLLWHAANPQLLDTLSAIYMERIPSHQLNLVIDPLLDPECRALCSAHAHVVLPLIRRRMGFLRSKTNAAHDERFRNLEETFAHNDRLLKTLKSEKKSRVLSGFASDEEVKAFVREARKFRLWVSVKVKDDVANPREKVVRVKKSKTFEFHQQAQQEMPGVEAEMKRLQTVMDELAMPCVV